MAKRTLNALDTSKFKSLTTESANQVSGGEGPTYYYTQCCTDEAGADYCSDGPYADGTPWVR